MFTVCPPQLDDKLKSWASEFSTASPAPVCLAGTQGFLRLKLIPHTWVGFLLPLRSPNSHSDHSSSHAVSPLKPSSALGSTTTTAKVSVSNQLRLRFGSVIQEVPKITPWPGAGQMTGAQSSKPALENSVHTCGARRVWSVSAIGCICAGRQPVLWTPQPQSSCTTGQIPKRE